MGSSGILKQRVVMMCSKQMTLVHLSTVVAYLNELAKEEWSNFEFYPGANLKPEVSSVMVASGPLRPYNHRCTLEDIAEVQSCDDRGFGEIVLVYRKRTMPQFEAVNMQKNLII